MVFSRVLGNLGQSSGGYSSELGKRNADTAGLGSIVFKKIYIPTKEHPDVNFIGMHLFAQR